MPEKLIIDTDPATGYILKDVDDGLAILYILGLSGEFEVLGITTVFGNASLDRTTRKAEEILRVARREDIGVYRGAGGRRLLGIDSEASLFLEESVSTNPAEITVLALGPLTNIATAGSAGDDFYRNVKRVVTMGGALSEGFGIPLVSPLEFNFFADIDAAESVLRAPCEKIVITADLCRQAIFTRRELESLFRMRNPVSVYLAYRIEPWLKLNQVLPIPGWKGGFVPWDVVAAVYLNRPDLFGGVLRRGMTISRGLLPTGAIAEDTALDDRPSSVPTSLESDELLDEFLRVIGSLGA